MDIGVALISGLFGAGGLISLVQFLISRHDKKDDELKAIKKELNGMRDIQHEIIVRVTRGELKDLIRDDPDNIEAITQVGGYYFVDLDGDAYMHTIFEKWAKQHDVATGWLPKYKDERSKKK